MRSLNSQLLQLQQNRNSITTKSSFILFHVSLEESQIDDHNKGIITVTQQDTEGLSVARITKPADATRAGLFSVFKLLCYNCHICFWYLYRSGETLSP